MYIKTERKTQSGRDIYMDGNREIVLPLGNPKHQVKLPNYVYHNFKTPQLKGVFKTDHIVVRPIIKAFIKGDNIILHQQKTVNT